MRGERGATMKIGYFPGCSLHATAREYDESLRLVASALDIELDEVRDWACCGATSAHATNRVLSVALPARTLAQAERQKLSRVLSPCAACYNRLATARHRLANDRKTAARVQSILGYGFDNSVGVVSIAELLSEAKDEIRKKAKVPLTDLKVACYYGCLLVRPPDVCGFDDPEVPSSLESIVSATGATAVKWSMALECCGGGFSLSRTASVVRLGRLILQAARNAGAQIMVVACPMCHSNLDFRQRAMQERGGFSDSMPILFLSELVGLSLGLDPGRLGLTRHFVSPQPLLDRIGAPQSLPKQTEQA
jgi:heterodisulfide reductase subunit B